MSIIRKVISALVALAALTVMAPGQAETPDSVKEGQNIVVAQIDDRLQSFVTAISTPVINVKEVTCLARNIFFEAANEPEEGKVAVGLVTLNRARDGRFGKGVCGVVDQRTTTLVQKQKFRTVKNAWGQTKTETYSVFEKFTVCQFSWRCMTTKTPKTHDERWIESQEIARNLLAHEYTYEDYRNKYGDALYFHATSIRPSWAKQKEKVAKVGGHYFYEDKNRNISF